MENCNLLCNPYARRLYRATNYQTGTVQSHGGAEISYRDFGGTGLPILFIPGWVCSQEWWGPLVARLAPSLRAITFDYPGVGSSGLGNRQWALENFARDAKNILEFLDLRDVVLVGHSMGGGVALDAAYLCPDRVTRVVGCDAYTYLEFYPRFDDRKVDEFLSSYRQDFPGSMTRGIGAYFLPGGDAELRARVSGAMANAEPESAIATMENFLRWDLDASLARCPVPVAAINAGHFLSPAMRERYGARMDIRTVDGVGHFLMLEKPAEVAVLLMSIISGTAD